MKSKNTIEFNGQRYDATTGDRLAGSSAATTASLDGFFTSPVAGSVSPRPGAHKITVHDPADAAQPRATVPVRRASASHAQPHQPQTAVTLMRTAVKRPGSSIKKQLAVQSALQHATPNLIASKQSAYHIDPSRLSRATQTAHSPLVSRHGAVASAHIVPVTVAPISVQPVPERPEAQEPAAVPEPGTKPLDMFERAIANASHYVDVKAHHARFKKHRRNYALSLTAGGFALIVIAGFAAYHNSPSLQLKMASVQSGVPASLPAKTTGFTYDGVQAGDGKLQVDLSAQHVRYKVVQQATNLSSDDMISSIGSVDASGYPTYSTVQTGGVQVYRFSNNDATWIANGKWYTVSGSQALSDSQVTTLVKNL